MRPEINILCEGEHRNEEYQKSADDNNVEWDYNTWKENQEKSENWADYEMAKKLHVLKTVEIFEEEKINKI